MHFFGFRYNHGDMLNACRAGYLWILKIKTYPKWTPIITLHLQEVDGLYDTNDYDANVITGITRIYSSMSKKKRRTCLADRFTRVGYAWKGTSSKPNQIMSLNSTVSRNILLFFSQSIQSTPTIKSS